MFKKISIATLITFFIFTTLTFAYAPWQSKPPVGSVIDWSNPLSNGLVSVFLMNEGGGKTLINLVNQSRATSFLSSWNNNIKGGGIKITSNTTYSQDANIKALSNNFSAVVIGYANITTATTSTFLGSKTTSTNGWSFKAEQYNNTGKVGFTTYGTASQDQTSNIQRYRVFIVLL
jgi:hypothetical protein